MAEVLVCKECGIEISIHPKKTTFELWTPREVLRGLIGRIQYVYGFLVGRNMIYVRYRGRWITLDNVNFSHSIIKRVNEHIEKEDN